MLEVRVPDDINEYHERIIAGLSIRQLISIGAAIAVAVPSFFLLRNISMELAVYAPMVVAIPIVLVGFFKKDGYFFEDLVMIRLKYYFSRTRRGYETDVENNQLPIEAEGCRRLIQDYYKEVETRKTAESLGKNKGFGLLRKKEEGESEKIVFDKKEKIKERKSGKAHKGKTRESYLIEVSAKNSKAKRKAAAKAIKASTRSYRTAERKEEKTA